MMDRALRGRPAGPYEVGWHLLTPIRYLAAMGALGLLVPSRRLGRLILRWARH